MNTPSSLNQALQEHAQSMKRAAQYERQAALLRRRRVRRRRPRATTGVPRRNLTGGTPYSPYSVG